MPKYLILKALSLRDIAVKLTPEQYDRRVGNIVHPKDEDGNDKEELFLPKDMSALQFKAGEIIETEEELPKVYQSELNPSAKEVTEEEAEEHLENQRKSREEEAKKTTPSEFTRRPVPDRTNSPNAQRVGESDEDFQRRLESGHEETEEVEEVVEDPVTKEQKVTKVKRKKNRR